MTRKATAAVLDTRSGARAAAFKVAGRKASGRIAMPLPSGLRCHTKGVAWKSHSTKSNTALHQILEPDTGAACLPGGTPELQDRGDPVLTLRRETREEAAAEVGEPLFIGHLAAPDETCSRLRYAAALTRLGPAPVDPATGRTYIRILAIPEQALELFDWGESAADQLAALHQARTRLGIPKAVRQPLTEPAADAFTL
ncbi:hypothetical protein [Streptomyces peucetius]|uniref:Nudix hydrolase domain-containing protein n=1 Tax=Streptomyces peucetius TaxID=1950 RepID=A0ABY6IIS5_STRPE|nr:hypothetical protein [Streptomyces peucetius]UYQ66801.1 hypothetical protein OGH68_00270 [Streptomyces peucetius]